MIIAIPDHPIQNLRLRISGGTAQRSGRTPLAPVIFQAGALFTQTVTNSLADSISYITPISLPFSLFFFSFWRLKVRNRKSRWRLQGDSGLELPALNPFVPQDLQLFARTMTRYDQIWPDMTRLSVVQVVQWYLVILGKLGPWPGPAERDSQRKQLCLLCCSTETVKTSGWKRW